MGMDELMNEIEGIPVVKFERISDDAYIPVRAHESDSGYDIRIPKGLHLKPNEVQLANTGIRIELPRGYECQVRSRSGMPVKHSIVFALGVGTIDQGYRGEIKIPLWNITLENERFKDILNTDDQQEYLVKNDQINISNLESCWGKVLEKI